MSFRNPITGKQIKIDGPTHRKLITDGTLSKKTSQSGGNPLIAGLPALTELAIPVGLTVASYFAHSYLTENPEQTAGGHRKPSSKEFPYQKAGNPLITAASQLTTDPQFSSQNGGNLVKTIAELSVPLGLTWAAHRQQTGGYDSVPILGDKLLDSYLGMNGIKILSPETLIPLGILMALYAGYNDLYKNRKPVQKGGFSQQITDLVDRDDWKKYTKFENIKEVTPQTKIPFAVIMGPDVFHQYVLDLNKHQKK